jgi:hypothetical protein
MIILHQIAHTLLRIRPHDKIDVVLLLRSCMMYSHSCMMPSFIQRSVQVVYHAL